MTFKFAILPLAITVFLPAQSACSIDTMLQEQVNEGFPKYKFSFKPFPEYVRKALPDENTLLQDLKDRGLVSKSAAIKKTLKPGSGLPDLSVSAGFVIFIKDAADTVVAKVFKYTGDYYSELAGYEKSFQYQETVDDLRQNSSIVIPMIVHLKEAAALKHPDGGDDVGVFLLEKARGKSLEDYIKHIAKMTKHEIKYVFSNIGEQFGSLDFLMLEKENTILQHNDSFSRNFFYDIKRNQAYWIDIAGKGGLSVVYKVNGLEDLIFLRILYIDAYNAIISHNEEGALRLIQAIHYFAQGYFRKNTQDSVRLYHNKFHYSYDNINLCMSDYIRKNHIDWDI